MIPLCNIVIIWVDPPVDAYLRQFSEFATKRVNIDPPLCNIVINGEDPRPPITYYVIYGQPLRPGKVHQLVRIFVTKYPKWAKVWRMPKFHVVFIAQRSTLIFGHMHEMSTVAFFRCSGSSMKIGAERSKCGPSIPMILWWWYCWR